MSEDKVFVLELPRPRDIAHRRYRRFAVIFREYKLHVRVNRKGTNPYVEARFHSHMPVERIPDGRAYWRMMDEGCAEIQQRVQSGREERAEERARRKERLPVHHRVRLKDAAEERGPR
jgi:hypothetical protein